MNLRELVNRLGFRTIITVTASAYSKNTGKYYSFRTMTENAVVSDCCFTDYELDLEVTGIRVDCPRNVPVLFIEVREFVDV